MSYFNDPREMAIQPKSGVTWEEDNRVEPMWHWGAAILDLCGLPVSEYMKPSTVIVAGYSSGNTSGDTSAVTEQDVNIYVSIIDESGTVVSTEAISSSPSPILFGATPEEATTKRWRIKWEWVGKFSGSIKSVVKVNVGDESYMVSATLTDNEDKQHEETLSISSESVVTSFETYGIGSMSTPDSAVTQKTYEELNTTEKVKYKYEISDEVSIVYLSVIYTMDGTEVYKKSDCRYKDPIPQYSGETEWEGYDFSGWKLSDNTEYTGTTMPAKNLKFFGHHTIKTFTVNFDLSGKTTSISGVTYGTVLSANKFPSTTKVGYTFLGWEPDSATPITQDTNFVGSYKQNDYIITWKYGNDMTSWSTYHYGDIINYNEFDTSKEGYTFTRWSYTGKTMPANDLTITASYNINSYCLKYILVYANGSSYTLSSSYRSYGSSINNSYTIPDSKKHIGCEYSEFESSYSGNTMPSYEVDYIAYETKIDYTLAYYVDDDFYSAQTYNYNDTVNPLYKPEKEGYTVSDWSGVPSKMPNKNVSATCITTINFYDVTFVDQSGNTIDEGNYMYGTPISSITPTVEGHTYETLSGTPETVPANDLVVYGNLTVNEYEVKFILSDGNEETVKLLYGTNVIDYVKDNYTAEEGYHISNIDTLFDTVPAYDGMEVTVTYEPNEWNLSYNLENVSSGNSVVKYSEPIADYLPDTNFEGTPYEMYNFNGWFVGDEELQSGATMPNNDLEVLGKTSIKEFSVSVEAGESAFTYIVEYGTTSLEILSKDEVSDYISSVSANGYTVVYSINGVDVTGEEIITSDVVFNEKLIPNKYILTFYNEEEVISQEEKEFKSIITYPEMPDYEVSGITYSFEWEDKSYDGKEMPNENLDINGSYKEKNDLIYYGTFTNGIFNEEQFNSIFKSLTVEEAIKTTEITITLPADETYIEMAKKAEEDPDFDFDTWKSEYDAAHLAPSVIMLPEEIAKQYEIKLYLKADGLQKTFVKNGNAVVNGVTYIMYQYVEARYMHASDTEQNWIYTLTMTKKEDVPMDTTIYFGTSLNGDVTLDDISGYTTNDISEFEEGKDVTISLNADNVYVEMANRADTDPDFDFDAWKEEYDKEHTYPACFLISSSANEEYNFEIVLVADGQKKDFAEVEGKTIEINGSEFIIYEFCEARYMHASDTVQEWKYNIKITKK